jgi:CSLREA domain-containing protein
MGISLFLLFVAAPSAAVWAEQEDYSLEEVTTITVNSTADVIADDGQCTLREAITAANTDTASGSTAGECLAGSGADTITLPARTYTLTITGKGEDNNATGDLDITSDITINGAGSDFTTIQAGTTDSNGVDRVFNLVNGSGTLTLNGVTVRHGRATGAHGGDPDSWGGGVLNDRGTLSIENSTLSGNWGEYVGGAVNNSYGTVNVDNSILSSNSAGSHGGGVYNRGTLNIENSTLSDNSASRDGGGVDNYRGTVSINNSTLSGNYARTLGGGVSNFYGTMNINNSTISGNSGGYNCGGGVYNYLSGTLSIESSAISDNSTSTRGGGVCNDGTASIKNSAISGNSAGSWGGGVHNQDGTMSIENSTLSANTADRFGGAVSLQDGTVEVAYSTITDNAANYDEEVSYGRAGGIYTNGGAVTFKSTILSGNFGAGLIYDDCNANYGGTFSSQGYNLVGDGTGCPANGTTDQVTNYPELIFLADSNGDTQTRALLSSSPALNNIPLGENGCGLGGHSDQRGVLRPVGETCDIGAYEAGGVFWDGGGGDNNWTTAANWSRNALPNASDTVVFNSRSAKDATLNDAFTLAGLVITSGYEGTLTQVDNLTLSDHFGQSGGTFAGGSGTVDVGGSFDLSGGTFSSPSGGMAVSGDWNQSGGDITQNASLTVSGAWNQDGGTYTGGSSTLDLGGAFNLTGGTFTAPTGLMSVGGGFHRSGGTFDPNSGRVVLDNTSDQTLSGGATFNDLVLNDGLLGYWKLDEGSGTIASDSSGYGHDGTLHNSPIWSTDTPSMMDFSDPYVLGFNRTDSVEYVTMSGTTQIDQAQELTLSTWVNLGSTPAGSGYTYMRFITLGNEKAVLRYADLDGSGKLQFYMKIDESILSVAVDPVWQTDTWYHVAGTYDGSNMRLYLNGVEQGSYSTSGTVANGDGIILSGSGADENLDGLMDDVRVYNRALSATQIGDMADGKHPTTSQATTSQTSTLDINGDLTLNSGTLVYESINLAGDFTRNGGVFEIGGGTVTFDGSGTQTLDTDNIAFHDLTVISGAALNLGDKTLPTVEGVLANNGSLLQTKDVNQNVTTLFLRIQNQAEDATKYYGVDMNPLGDMGVTTITIGGNQDCTTNTDSQPVQRCFDISPTTAHPAEVTFWYLESERNDNMAYNVNVHRWDGSAWVQETGTVSRADDGTNYSVQVTHVDEYSPFMLSEIVNSPPAADDDTYSTDEGTNLIVVAPGVLGNDSDLDGDTLTAVLDTSPSDGFLGLNLYGSFAYFPSANFCGSDSFTYHANDGADDSNIATVTIDVTCVNDPPSFTPGGDVTVDEDSGAYDAAWASDISAGPANESGQTVSFAFSANSNPSLFLTGPTIDPDGNLRFTPKPDAHGSATISVRLQDDGGTANSGDDTSETENFTISVTPINDAPAATSQEITVEANTSQDITLAYEDVETALTDLAFSMVASQAHGTLTGTAPELTYTPATGFTGDDSFTFTVTDRGDPDGCIGSPPACSSVLTSAAATVTIHVEAAVPVLTVISPASAQAGGIDDVTLSLTGSGFLSASQVMWNGTTGLVTTYVDAEHLSAVISATLLSSVQTAQITVFTLDPGQRCSMCRRSPGLPAGS